MGNPDLQAAERLAKLHGASVIARSTGIVCIALGFVSGMHGLDRPDSVWLQTALGLIVTGILAQGYALYCALRRMRIMRSEE